ncbi:hypothetical protein AW736_02415 [Termitidicoccus mucosus]|uniref:Uncharacterized protein n=1 Tax=Termitidicoccus mucosus TaxID=1184151 RepID=A0A178INX1_9BACT|nr:hypothetical protein AW736_02415 [Opitutaceae bacterium TSB47]
MIISGLPINSKTGARAARRPRIDGAIGRSGRTGRVPETTGLPLSPAATKSGVSARPLESSGGNGSLKEEKSRCKPDSDPPDAGLRTGALEGLGRGGAAVDVAETAGTKSGDTSGTGNSYVEGTPSNGAVTPDFFPESLPLFK